MRQPAVFVNLVVNLFKHWSGITFQRAEFVVSCGSDGAWIQRNLQECVKCISLQFLLARLCIYTTLIIKALLMSHHKGSFFSLWICTRTSRFSTWDTWDTFRGFIVNLSMAFFKLSLSLLWCRSSHRLMASIVGALLGEIGIALWI